MAPKNKKLSREELLEKKREAEKQRYLRRKNDPQKREEMREKEKLKYQKKKQKGLRKLVKDMTPREHRSALKKWKEHCTVYTAANGIRNSYYNTGEYVLVKFPTKNVEYRYAAVINEIDDDENDLRVTFLKVCDKQVQTFRIDEKDISDVSFDQIIQKLDNPNIILRGKRIFYKFPTEVDVFER